MMKKPFVALLLLSVVVGSAAGQEPVRSSEPGAPPPGGNIKVRVDLVNVLMTVTNKKNHLENGLS